MDARASLAEMRPERESMQEELLSLLVCLECGGPLQLKASSAMDGNVVTEWLACACGATYPILDTIPRLLRGWEKAAGRDRLTRWTQQRFGFQWQTFHEMSCDFWENFLTYIGPVKPEFFNGKLGLDAGCGFGRHLLQAVRCGARMVGVDFSRAIESSLKNTWGNPRIGLVQADLEQLPFAPGSFDFVYSIGVLHHLPDPFRGFSSLVRSVKPGGAILVWCYSNQRRWTMRVLEGIRLVTRRLPRRLLYGISIILGGLEWALLLAPFRAIRASRLQRWLARRWPRLGVYAPYPFQVVCADWLDRLAAPLRHYYAAEELEGWGAQLHLEQVRVTPTGLYGWTLYAQRPVASPAMVGQG